jgi:hypothetical protein
VLIDSKAPLLRAILDWANGYPPPTMLYGTTARTAQTLTCTHLLAVNLPRERLRMTAMSSRWGGRSPTNRTSVRVRRARRSCSTRRTGATSVRSAGS